MPDAIIRTAWGYGKVYSQAPHTLLSSGPDWEIWKRATASWVGFVLVNGKTTTNIATSLERIQSWVEEKIGRGLVEVPPTEPPLPKEPTQLYIKTSPTTASIFVDGVDTGRLTNYRFETTPGFHTIRLEKPKYKTYEAAFEAKEGKTTEYTITLEKIEVPAEPPKVPERIEDVPKEPRSLLEAASLWLTGDVPDWLDKWEDFLDWLTETFGTELPAIEADKLTGGFKIKPEGKKVLFFISMKAPVTALGKAAAGAIAKGTASSIIAQARGAPAKLAKEFLKLPANKRVAAHAALRAVGREGIAASDALLRVTLAPIKKLAAPTWLKWLAGVTAVSTIFIGFQLSDAIFGLRKQKVLPPFQSEELKEVSIAANNIVNRLETIKFSCDKKSFDLVLEEILTLSKKWDSLIEYAKANPLNPEQIQGFIDNTMAYVGLIPPRTSDAMLATIEGAKTAFTLNAEVEIKAIRENCAWTPEEAEEKLYGTIILNTEPSEVIVRIAGEEKKATTGDQLRLIAGSHDIVLEAEGFQSRRRTIIVKEGEAETISFILERIPEAITPRAGRLQILVYDDKTGAPITATLLVDGRIEEFPGHQFVLDLVPDTYELRIEKAGYDFYEDTIVIDEGVITPIVARLKKIPELELPIIPEVPEVIEPKVPEKGRLEVSANIEAQIAVGGKDTGKKTPASFDLTQGFYTVRLEAEGFWPRTTTTLVKAGELTAVALELTSVEAPPPKQRLARVSIISSPVAAKILVNGVWTKQYTPDSVLLEPGDYEISLAKTGYKIWTTPLRLVEE